MPRASLFSRPRLLALLACVALGSACGGEGPARPDLVLITVDRFATDRLPCFEGEIDPGDAVCALAEGGTLFAWTAASGAGEAAAAASVLTGLPPELHGVTDDGQSFLRDPNVTIAEELSQAGYATAAFVASPRVNRSRRLDQGFAYYDDRFASPARLRLVSGTELADLDAQVRDWFERTPSPRFLWIHLDRDAGQVQLDRLVSRLAEPLKKGATGPGIIFVGLRGEGAADKESGAVPLSGSGSSSPPRAPAPAPARAAARDSAGTFEQIGWRSHRVPLIWRPPAVDAPSVQDVPPVSRTLASLYDINPTLRAAAAIPSPTADTRLDTLHSPHGRDLSRLIRPDSRPDPPAGSPPDSLLEKGEPDPALSSGPFGRAEISGSAPFFVLLEAAGGQIGLAAQDCLYTRQRSPLDGTGRPVPTVSLEVRGARFSTIEREDMILQGRPRTARLRTGPWRTDILSSDSPVPQLEFHLARRLDRPSENPSP